MQCFAAAKVITQWIALNFAWLVLTFCFIHHVITFHYRLSWRECEIRHLCTTGQYWQISRKGDWERSTHWQPSQQLHQQPGIVQRMAYIFRFFLLEKKAEKKSRDAKKKDKKKGKRRSSDDWIYEAHDDDASTWVERSALSIIIKKNCCLVHEPMTLTWFTFALIVSVFLLRPWRLCLIIKTLR